MDTVGVQIPQTGGAIYHGLGEWSKYQTGDSIYHGYTIDRFFFYTISRGQNIVHRVSNIQWVRGLKYHRQGSSLIYNG